MVSTAVLPPGELPGNPVYKCMAGRDLCPFFLFSFFSPPLLLCVCSKLTCLAAAKRGVGGGMGQSVSGGGLGRSSAKL